MRNWRHLGAAKPPQRRVQMEPPWELENLSPMASINRTAPHEADLLVHLRRLLGDTDGSLGAAQLLCAVIEIKRKAQQWDDQVQHQQRVKDPNSVLRFVSAKELAERTNRHVISIYRWAKHAPSRLPPSLKVGGSLVFLSSEVDSWLLAQAAAGGEVGMASPKRQRGRPTKIAKAHEKAQQLAAKCDDWMRRLDNTMGRGL